MNQGIKNNRNAEMTITIALLTVLSLWSIIWRGTPACLSSSASVLVKAVQSENVDDPDADESALVHNAFVTTRTQTQTIRNKFNKRRK